MPGWCGRLALSSCRSTSVRTRATGARSPVELSSTRRRIDDGRDAVRCAQAFGCLHGPLCLDVEYGTYMGNIAGRAGVSGCLGLGRLGCRLPAGAVQRLAHATGLPADVPTGMWVANWNGVGDLSQMPNAERFTGLGWQYADNWKGFDISNVDGVWWHGSPVPAADAGVQPGRLVTLQTGNMGYTLRCRLPSRRCCCVLVTVEFVRRDQQLGPFAPDAQHERSEAYLPLAFCHLCYSDRLADERL